MGAIRANQEVSAENQRNINQIQKYVNDLRTTVRDNSNWIKEKDAIQRNRDEILRQNYYSLIFKSIITVSVLFSSFAVAGMLYRLNQFITQQNQVESTQMQNR